MQLKSLKNNSIHISEGNPEKCMLYRYGVLAKDEMVESNDFCKIDGETIDKDKYPTETEKQLEVKIENLVNNFNWLSWMNMYEKDK